MDVQRKRTGIYITAVVVGILLVLGIFLAIGVGLGNDTGYDTDDPEGDVGGMSVVG